MQIFEIAGGCIREDGTAQYVLGVSVTGSKRAPLCGGIVMEHQHGRKDVGMVTITWIQIDSKLTLNLISNLAMLKNICTVSNDQAIHVNCNSRTKIMNKVRDMSGYGTVCYYPTRIANIISLSWAVHSFTVQFNSGHGGNFFQMTLPDRDIRSTLRTNGLHFFD